MSDSTSSENIFIFETVDPLNNSIYLTHEQYNQHIAPRHPEIAGEEKLIQKSVEEPNKIVRDNIKLTTYNYYFEHDDNFLKNWGKYVKVVVCRESMGKVITAFFTPNIKEITTPIYVKP